MTRGWNVIWLHYRYTMHTKKPVVSIEFSVSEKNESKKMCFYVFLIFFHLLCCDTRKIKQSSETFNQNDRPYDASLSMIFLLLCQLLHSMRFFRQISNKKLPTQRSNAHTTLVSVSNTLILWNLRYKVSTQKHNTEYYALRSIYAIA